MESTCYIDHRGSERFSQNLSESQRCTHNVISSELSSGGFRRDCSVQGLIDFSLEKSSNTCTSTHISTIFQMKNVETEYDRHLPNPGDTS